MAKQQNLDQWLKKSSENERKQLQILTEDSTENKVTFMQFYKFSNIKDLLITDIHQKYADEEKRKEKCKDVVVFAHFVYEKYCKNSRIDLLENLKFQPKPWLTKKDHKIRRKFGIEKEVRVKLGSNNEIHAFAKEFLPTLTQEMGIEAENASISDHLNSYLKKEIARYGSVVLALLSMEAKRVYCVDENRIARVISKPCPTSRKVILLKHFLEQLSMEAEMSRTRFLEAMDLRKVNFTNKASTNLDKNITYRRKFTLDILHETTNSNVDPDSSLEIQPKPGKRRRVIEDSEFDDLPGPIVDDGGSNFKISSSRAINTKPVTGNETPRRYKPCPLSKRKFIEPDDTDDDSSVSKNEKVLSSGKEFSATKDTKIFKMKPCPLSRKKFFVPDEIDDGAATEGSVSKNEKVCNSDKEFKAKTEISKIKDGKATNPPAPTEKIDANEESVNDSRKLRTVNDITNSPSHSKESKPKKNIQSSKPVVEKSRVACASKGAAVKDLSTALGFKTTQQTNVAALNESVANKTCKPQAVNVSPSKRIRASPKKKSRIIRMKPDKNNFYDTDDSEQDTSMMSGSVAESGSNGASLRNASLLSNGLTKQFNHEQINDAEIIEDKENLDTTITSESVEGEIYFVQIPDIDFLFKNTNINELLLEKLRQMFSQIADWGDELINEKCIKKVVSKMTPDMKKKLLSIKNLRLNEAFVEKAKESTQSLKEIDARQDVVEKTLLEASNTQHVTSEDERTQAEPLFMNDLRPNNRAKRSKFNILLEKSRTFEEFKRNTNIEEFMRNDIIRRYPSTSDTMLPKIDRFMKNFYQKHFLKGEMPAELTLKNTASNDADDACRRNKEDSNVMESTASVIPNSRDVQITNDSVQCRTSKPISMTQVYDASQGTDHTDRSAQEKRKGSRFDILFEKSKTYEDFRRNTNIEEFMRNDIIKRHPATSDLMLPKIEKFMKNFYKKYFLNGQIPAQLTLKCVQNSAEDLFDENGVPNTFEDTRKDQSLHYTCSGSQNSLQNETLNKVFLECNSTISQAYAEHLLQHDHSVDLFPSTGSSVSKSGNKKPSNESIPQSTKPIVDPLSLSDIVPAALNECIYPILHLLSPENIECIDSSNMETAGQKAKIVKTESAISDRSMKDKSLNLRVTQSQNLGITIAEDTGNQKYTSNSQNTLPATPAKSSQRSNTFLKALESPGLINCSILDEIDFDEPTPVKEELQFSRYSDDVEYIPTAPPSVIQIEDDAHNASNLLNEMMMACPIESDNNILRLNAGVGQRTTSLSFDPKSMPQSTQLPFTDFELAARYNDENSKNCGSQVSSTEVFEGIRNSDEISKNCGSQVSSTEPFEGIRNSDENSKNCGSQMSSTEPFEGIRNSDENSKNCGSQMSSTEPFEGIGNNDENSKNCGSQMSSTEPFEGIRNNDVSLKNCGSMSSTEPFEGIQNSEDDLPPTVVFMMSQAFGDGTQRNTNGQLDSTTRTTAAEVTKEDFEPSTTNENRERNDNSDGEQTELADHNTIEPPTSASHSSPATKSTKNQSLTVSSKDVEFNNVDEIPQTLKTKKTKQKLKPSLSKVSKKREKNAVNSVASLEESIVPQVKHTFQPLEIKFHRNAFVARKRKRKEHFFIDTTNILRHKIQKPAARNKDDTDFFIEDVTQEIEQNDIENFALTADLLNVDSSYFRSSQLAPNHYLPQNEENTEQVGNEAVIGANNQDKKSPQNSVINYDSNAKVADIAIFSDEQCNVPDYVGCEIVIESESIQLNSNEDNRENPSSECEQIMLHTESLPTDSRVEDDYLQKPSTQSQIGGGQAPVVNIIDQIIIVPVKKGDSREANQKESLHEHDIAETTVREIIIDTGPKKVITGQSIENQHEAEKNAENIIAETITVSESEEANSNETNQTLEDQNLFHEVERNAVNRQPIGEKCTAINVAEKSIYLNKGEEQATSDGVYFSGKIGNKPSCFPKTSNESTAYCIPAQINTALANEKQLDTCNSKYIGEKVGSNSTGLSEACRNVLSESRMHLTPFHSNNVFSNEEKQQVISSTDDSCDSNRIKFIERNHVENNVNEVEIDSTSVTTKPGKLVTGTGVQALPSDEVQHTSNCTEDSSKKVSLSCLSDAERTIIENYLDEILMNSPEARSDSANDEMLHVTKDAMDINADGSKCLRLQETEDNVNKNNVNEGANSTNLPENQPTHYEKTERSLSQSKGFSVQSNQVAIRVNHNIVNPNVTASEFSLGEHLDIGVLSEENRLSETDEKSMDPVHANASQTIIRTEFVEKSAIQISSVHIIGDSLLVPSVCSKNQEKTIALEERSALTSMSEPNEKTIELSRKTDSVLETAFCIEEASMNSSVGLIENKKNFSEEGNSLANITAEIIDTTEKSSNSVCPAALNTAVSSILNVRTLETIEEEENETEATDANCTSAEDVSKDTSVRTSDAIDLLSGHTFAPKKSLVTQHSMASFEQLTLNNVQLTDIHSRMHRPLKNFYYGHITYLSLYKIKLSANVNRLRYESSVPFLQPFEKNPIQAVIDFRNGPYKKLYFCGTSLRLLLGLTVQEWLSVFNILRSIETYEYSVFEKDPIDRSLFHRILYYLFKTLPKFSQVTFEYDISNINYATSCLEKRQYKTPFKCLSQAFDSDILQAMARAKRDL